MKLHLLLAGAVLASVSVCSTFGAKLGDTAAPLAIKEWVKGKATDVQDGKNIYVVEFWATWCGPCRTSIPHLSELQARFKDKNVVFVGVSDEDAATVKPFVEKMGDKMSYTVACDDSRKTSAGYMEAYGQGGIPTAFVVGKDGKVLWFGHPMGELEKSLDEIVSGKFDLQAAIKKDEGRAVRDEYNKLSMAGDEKARELGRKVLASTPGDVEELVGFAFNIAANMRNKNRDFTLADEALDKAEKLAGARDSRVLGTRAIIRFESGKEEEGLQLAKEAVENCKNDKEKPRYQNYVRVMESRIKAKAAKTGKDEEKKDSK